MYIHTQLPAILPVAWALTIYQPDQQQLQTDDRYRLDGAGVLLCDLMFYTPLSLNLPKNKGHSI